MRVLWWIDRVLLVVLGVSTGAVKLAQMPEEMTLFAGAGVPDAVTIGFGAVQLLASLACIPNISLRVGASVLAVTFVLATAVVFVNGLWVFGVSSLLFVAMAAWPAVVGAAGPRRRDATVGPASNA